MVIYYPTIEIPMLCAGIVLWIFCCHFAKKHREADGWPDRPNNSPSVYIIPIYEEEQEDEEEGMDVNEAYSSYREPPMYCSRDVSPLPPYMLYPPSYTDPPPPYTEHPAYSEQP